MADFNYKLLTEIQPIAAVSASVYTNAAATASYIRTIVLHNVTSSVQNVMLWKSVGASAVDTAHKFFNYAISGSGTFMLEFGAPGLMLTQSSDAIYAATTDANGVNITIVGGTE